MPKVRVDLQPVVGLTNVHDYFSAYAYDKSGYSAQFGVLAYVWIPLTNEKLFFKTGVIHSKVGEANYAEFRKKITTNHDYYKIPLQFQYIFLKHRVYPTFGMGVNAVLSKGKPAMFLPAFNVGATITITNKLYLSLCAEADYLSPYFIIPSANSILASNSFTVGFSWKM